MYDERTINGENFAACLETGETENAELIGQAAAIIHSRTRYRDYREGLLARPEDMTEAQAYQWKQRFLRCTIEPEEMRAGHQVRRAVISDGVYGVAGVAAYFRDIATGSFEDEGRRPAYGFAGLVWKQDSLFRPSCFPSTADFRLLVEKYVIPRWEEPKNGKDAEKATLSGYQEQWIEAFGVKQADAGVQSGIKAQSGAEMKPDTEAQADIEMQLRQALERAARGEQVFYCSGLPVRTDVENAPDSSDRAQTMSGLTQGISGLEPGMSDSAREETSGAVQAASGSGLNRGFAAAGIICIVAVGILIWKILAT